MCFINYTNAFDSVKHTEISTVLKQLNIDDKDPPILKDMFWQQTSAKKKKKKIMGHLDEEGCRTRMCTVPLFEYCALA